MSANIFALWGSNTGVGKTVVSAGLVAAARRAGLRASYLKPVQTGFPADSDGAFVARLAGGSHALGNHAETAASVHPSSSALAGVAFQCDDAGPSCSTLFAWRQPVSPHLAVEMEGRAVTDESLREAVRSALEPAGFDLTVVETAGGVASPAPSGSLQCDALLPLQLPAVLVGDGGLGGISATICAYESLSRRGGVVSAIVLLDGGLSNEDPLRKHLRCPVHVLPRIGAGAEAAEVEQDDAWMRSWLGDTATGAGLERLLDELIHPPA